MDDTKDSKQTDVLAVIEALSHIISEMSKMIIHDGDEYYERQLVEHLAYLSIAITKIMDDYKISEVQLDELIYHILHRNEPIHD